MSGRHLAGLFVSVFVFTGCGGANRGDRGATLDSGAGTSGPPAGDLATTADLEPRADLAPPADLTLPADLVDAGPTTAQLTVTVTGAGTVVSIPGGIACGTTCSADFAIGTRVVLVPSTTSSPGTSFQGWSGACSGIGLCTLDLAADSTVMATFVAPPVVGVAITSGPEALARSRDATFVFVNATGAASCTLDGTAAPCTSPASYAGLADGNHAFSVADAGSATSASWSWSVDGTPPATTLTGTPPNPSNVSAPSFSFAASEPATFYCRVDQAPYFACASPYRTSPIADGNHTFLVFAVDSAGNVDPAPQSYAWNIHTTKPVTTITSAPSAFTYDPQVTFTFATVDSESVTYACTIDNSQPLACTSPWTVGNLPEGTHTFTVVATDVAGNSDATPPSATWRFQYPWVAVGSQAGATLGYSWWTAALGSTLYLANGNGLAITFDTNANTFGSWANSGVCMCGYVGPFIAAGGDIFDFANSAVQYLSASDSWVGIPYPSADGEAGSTVLNGLIYLAGGRTTPTTVRTYDPVLQGWSTVASYPFNVYAPALATYGGKIYGFGGDTAGTGKVVTVYDPVADTWTTSPNAMPYQLAQSPIAQQAQPVGNRIYVEVVTDPNAFTIGIAAYDPVADAWDPTPIPLPTAAPSTASAQIVAANGKLFLVGDGTSANGVAATVWALKP